MLSFAKSCALIRKQLFLFCNFEREEEVLDVKLRACYVQKYLFVHRVIIFSKIKDLFTPYYVMLENNLILSFG